MGHVNKDIPTEIVGNVVERIELEHCNVFGKFLYQPWRYVSFHKYIFALLFIDTVIVGGKDSLAFTSPTSRAAKDKSTFKGVKYRAELFE